MTTRLFQMCSTWLQQLQDWHTLAPRGGGLSASLVTRQLLLPAYRKTFPGGLSWDDEERRMSLWLVEHEAQIVADLELVRRLTDRAADDARDRRVAVSAGEMADRLVRAVAKGLLMEEPFGEKELEMVASTYLANSPSLDRFLKREEFGQLQGLYDQFWLSEGAAHLAVHPYSRAMLGEDKRPPLVSTQRENTWQALSRSIYSRFRMAARDTSVSGTGNEIARAEVIRACGRLGLLHESTLVLLYSLLCGLQQGRFSVTDQRCPAPFDRDRSWQQIPGPITADGNSEAWGGLPVNGHLVARAEAMIRTFCAKREQGRYLLANEMMEYAHQHAMRRAWMDCFKHDRRSRVIDAKEAKKIVVLAVFKGIPSGEEHRRRARSLTAVDITRGSNPSSSSSRLAPDVLNRAWVWFAEHPEVVTGIVQKDPERLEEYRRAAKEFQLPELDFIMAFIPKEDS